MSDNPFLSASDDAVDFPYRALSRGAIFSLILAALALIGLIPPFEAVLSLAVLGCVVAVFSIRTIKLYPNEYSGIGLARLAMSVNTLILLGGLCLHTYIYLTEVPPGHVRVPFYKLQQEENVPDQPTELAYEIDGKKIFIKGYIHPSSGGGMLKQFILVPDLGTCCFGGQPKSSDMIEVTLKGRKALKGGEMTRQKLAGEFSLNKTPKMQAEFEQPIFYRLRGDSVK